MGCNPAEYFVKTAHPLDAFTVRLETTCVERAEKSDPPHKHSRSTARLLMVEPATAEVLDHNENDQRGENEAESQPPARLVGHRGVAECIVFPLAPELRQALRLVDRKRGGHATPR